MLMKSPFLCALAGSALMGLSFAANAIPCPQTEGVTCVSTSGFTRGDSLEPYSTEDVAFSGPVYHDEIYSKYLAEFTGPQNYVFASAATVPIVSTFELEYLRPVYLSPQPRVVLELLNPDGCWNCSTRTARSPRRSARAGSSRSSARTTTPSRFSMWRFT
jgi:hypothetical protein